MEDHIRVIEVGGVKMEVDLREAKRIEHYKVGDNVKVLVPEYGGKFKVQPGVILGFTEFEKLPTIEVAYLDISYSSAEVKFVAINDAISDDNKVEIAPLFSKHDITFRKGDIVKMMNDEIRGAKEKVKDLERKQAYFTEYFDKFFEVKA